MKKIKVFQVNDFPVEFHDKIFDKIFYCGGSCKWYSGDGHFKPLSEVTDMTKIHFYNNETIDTEDVYVYETGDDKIGDWLMGQGVGLCEEVLIIK